MVICFYLSIMAALVFFAADGAVKWIAYAAHIILFAIACHSWFKMKSRLDKAEKAIGTLARANNYTLEQIKQIRSETEQEKKENENQT